MEKVRRSGGIPQGTVQKRRRENKHHWRALFICPCALLYIPLDNPFGDDKEQREGREREPSVRNCTCKVRGNNLIFASYSHSRTGEHIHTHSHATHDKQRRVNCIRGKQKVVRGREENGTFFLVKVKGREAKRMLLLSSFNRFCVGKARRRMKSKHSMVPEWL